jgi:hypothetical protein
MKKLLLSVLFLTGIYMQNAFAITATYSECYCAPDGNSVTCSQAANKPVGSVQSNQTANLYHGLYGFPWGWVSGYKCDLGIVQADFQSLDIYPAVACDVTKCNCPSGTFSGVGGSCVPVRYCPANSTLGNGQTNVPAPGNILANCFLTPFPTSTACDHEGCKLTRTSQFDFNVQMGGVDASVYVCEVGFNELCSTAECTQHYLTLDNNTDTVANRIYDSAVFTESTAPSKANVYINDLFFGAEFYVKYCVKAKRLVVGAEEGVDFQANITPHYTISTGNYGATINPPNVGGANDYASTANLGASIYSDCTGTGPIKGKVDQGTLAVAPVLFSNLAALPQLPVGVLDLCGTTGCHSSEHQCVYTLRFTETATCYRPFKCEGGNCVPYESQIKTTFGADVRFDCDGASCDE